MNRYNNEYGFHTPQMTKQIIEYVNKETPILWYDNSWHNDVVDSIEYEISKDNMISIMLPNSFLFDIDQELFNTFTIIDLNQDVLFQSTDINEIVEYINTIIFPLINKI